MKDMLKAVLFVVALCMVGTGRAESVLRSLRGGRIGLSDPAVTLSLRIVFPGWLDQAYADGALLPESDKSRKLDFRRAKNAAAAKVTGRFAVASDGTGGADVDYHLDFPEGLAVEQVGLQGNLPRTVFENGVFVADGVRRRLDTGETGGRTLWHGKTGRAEFMRPDGTSALVFSFPRPVAFAVLRPKRSSEDDFCVRIVFAGKSEIRAGDVLNVAFKVRGAAPVSVDYGLPVCRAAGPDWIPFMPDTDIFAGSACDYSGLRGTVEKCGTHGRVVAKGGHFEFERLPGVAQRFYGANVCFDACYMDAWKSDRLVELLCRAGYNSVRLHHFDRKLTEASSDATVPDPARMRRLDHLLAKCYEAGLYVTTDFHIGRMVPRSVIERGASGRLSQEDFKRLVFTNELLRVNFKRYIANFMNHVNVETGRRYADEPGLFAIALVNEGPPLPTGSEDWRVQAVKLADMEMAHVADIRRFLRDEVKTSVLISNMSSGWSPSAYQLPRAKAYDYVDSHFYVDHPRFPVKTWSAPWQYNNLNPLRDPIGGGFPRIALTRLFEKPFVSTEYNYCAPFAYRMLGSVLTGSAAALQDWSGVWRFEWTMDPRDAVTLDYHEPFHATGFNTPGDPLQLVGEGLFAAFFLRGDLRPHPTAFAVRLDEATIKKGGSDEPYDLKRIPWTWAGWNTKIGTTFVPLTAGHVSADGPEAFGFDDARIATFARDVPYVHADRRAGTFVVSTPKSAALFAESGRLQAGDLEADVRLAPAAVWAIALDGKPFSETRRVQLVHLTDCQSTDMKQLPGAPLIVFDHGRLPFLMRRGTADVKLRLADDLGWRAYALSPGGRRLREVSYAFGDDGRMRLVCETAAEPLCATFLYELVR